MKPLSTQSQTPQTPVQIFRQILEQVAGQVFATSGYVLQETPLHLARGLFRYRKVLSSESEVVTAYTEFQMLYYQGGPSRFRVNLMRNTGSDARAITTYAGRIEITLTRLLWDQFEVEALGDADHWWQFSFNQPQQLGLALAEAGRYLFAFGIPYLEGTLSASVPD